MNNYPLLQVRNGMIAGAVATLPMTLFMLLVGRILPAWQHYDLPPEEITDELTERAGMEQHLDKQGRVGLALVAHFGYGSVVGGIYALVTKNIPLPPVLKGIIYGLGVWAGSYLGILPALQMRTRAPREPLQRNLLMIVAHIIWGASLGVAEENIAHK